VGLNVDTFDVATELSENPALRDAIVAQAEAFAQRKSSETEANQQAQLNFLNNQVAELNLPIGWPSDEAWWAFIKGQIAGWLVTAIAVSLGAPFWFDIINRFVRLRTAGNMGTVKSETQHDLRAAPAPD
jgi:hypothetical protein